MSDKRLFLRASLKLLSAFAAAWIIYIFIRGLLGPAEHSTNIQYSFDLSQLTNNSHTYFKTELRELLVIKHNNQFFIYWANDPIYGCKLEYLQEKIKPVCIDITYQLDGYSQKANQRLNSPEFDLYKNTLVIVE